MTVVPSGVIFIWNGTVASIPSGWSRVSALDGIFPRGASNGANAGATGGADHHSHDVPGHNHTSWAAHTHSGGSLDNYTATLACDGRTGSWIGTHNHSTSTSGSTTGTSQSYGDGMVNASNTLPSYYDVVFVKSNGTGLAATNIVGFWGSTIEQNGDWQYSLGDGYMLRGALAGQRSGATGGGAHNHTTPHTHTMDAHTHTGGTSGAASGTAYGYSGSTNNANRYHTHTYSLAAQSTSTSGAMQLGSVSSSNMYPPYIKLMAIENLGTGNTLPKGIIGMWDGDLDDAQALSGWYVCDGSSGTPDMRDRFVMISARETMLATGGSQSHGHAGSEHHHHHDHTHAYSVGNNTSASTSQSTSGGLKTPTTHNHSGTSPSATAHSDPVVINITDCSDSRPPYINVIFVQYSQPEAPNTARCVCEL